jgi:large repetitive protein
VSGSTITSNNSVITWGPGTDVTFLTLNQSPSGSMPAASITLVATLVDESQTPPIALSGQQINFTLGSTNCVGTTSSTGTATCTVTAPGAGLTSLVANFAGTSQYNASSDSRSFDVVEMAAPTPTPVPGKLKVSPKKINFGTVEVNGHKSKTVTIENLGVDKITKKKSTILPPITIEMENATSTSDPSPFSVTPECTPDEMLDPRSKGVKPGECTVSVTFAPTSAGKFSGNLLITDNVETPPSTSGSQQVIPLVGTGKAPK